MSAQFPPLFINNTPADPQLADLLNLHKKDIFLSLSCHHIGTVQSFDKIAQTATVTINYTKTVLKLNTQTQLYDQIQIPYPTLTNCPVVVLGGGAGSLTFPVAQGDECVVLFNDRDLDNWFAGGGVTQIASARLHSFTDALILVGVRSLANSLAAYDMTRAALNYGTTTVAAGETLVKIANATYTLNTLLQELITNVEALVAATAAITVLGTQVDPVPKANILLVATELMTTANQIAGLLE